MLSRTVIRGEFATASLKPGPPCTAGRFLLCYPWRIRHGLIEAPFQMLHHGGGRPVIRGEFATASLKRGSK